MTDSVKHDDDNSKFHKSRDAILPEPIGGAGIMQEGDGLGPADEDEDLLGRDIPGGQSRPLMEDEKLDKSLEDTFPTSDPIGPSRIDGPDA